MKKWNSQTGTSYLDHFRTEEWAARMCPGCGGLSLTRHPELGTSDPLAMDAPCIACGAPATLRASDFRTVVVERW